jgi:hypothetical protein
MKQEYFNHNGQKYGVGTEVWFTGMCYVMGNPVFLKDERCIFKHISLITGHTVFDVNGEEAWCGSRVFDKSICLWDERAIYEVQEELYLSKESFSKLLWYIIIMVVGVIFYDRWLIWIGATIVFITITPEVKQFIKNIIGGE